MEGLPIFRDLSGSSFPGPEPQDKEATFQKGLLPYLRTHLISCFCRVSLAS